MDKSYKRWVKDLVTTLSSEFNLQGWRIDIIWEDGFPDNDPDVIAWVNTDSDYLNANIHFTPTAEELWINDRGVLAENVVHELLHIVTDPLFKMATKSASAITAPHLISINEQMTQRLTRIVMQYLPKKFFSL